MPKHPQSPVCQRPTLSLCMIVKNEAETLERCLESAKGHVDEVVIVDTGSTDGTQQIAKKHADVFDEIEWPGSFSVARNYSYDLASKDYIIYLDGDEYLPKKGDWDQIHAGIKERGVAALKVRIRNILPDSTVLAADCMSYPRVTKNHPLIRFKGRVHNQIEQGVNRYIRQAGGKMVDVSSEIIHDGYALNQEEIDKKYRVRLPLLIAECEEAADEARRAYYMYQLGAAYSMLGEYDQTAAVLNEVNYDAMSDMNAFYTRVLATQANIREGKLEAALVHANGMFEVDRSEPVAYFLTGVVLFKMNKVAEALNMLIGAYEKNEEGQGKIRFALRETRLFKTIADICWQQGFWERSLFFYKEYLEEHPEDKVVNSRVSKLGTKLDTV